MQYSGCTLVDKKVDWKLEDKDSCPEVILIKQRRQERLRPLRTDSHNTLLHFPERCLASNVEWCLLTQIWWLASLWAFSELSLNLPFSSRWPTHLLQSFMGAPTCWLHHHSVWGVPTSPAKEGSLATVNPVFSLVSLPHSCSCTKCLLFFTAPWTPFYLLDWMLPNSDWFLLK